MKILILNHHFFQDINELKHSNSKNHTIKLIQPNYFANHAKKLFPEEVFGGNLMAYHKKEYENSRIAFRKIAFELLYDIFKIYQFDLFIAPSDTFFYIRDVIDACESLGVQFIVVQKELGVSPYLFEKHALELLESFPVKCDFMTTCSDDSKLFWCRAGGKQDKIFVVGQPRFDFYFRKLSIEESSNSPIKKQNKTNVLFLSYDLNAYSATVVDGRLNKPWEKIHNETIEALAEIAALDNICVYVKPHPQQDMDSLNKIKARVSNLENFVLLPGNTDTRLLILESDIIVGFQTTALLEAMAINKKVIYTFWSEKVEELKNGLLQFHTLANCINIAKSPNDIKYFITNPQYIIGGNEINQEQISIRKSEFVSLLGPVDGRSSERTWNIIEKVSESFSPTKDNESLRNDLLLGNTDFINNQIKKSISIISQLTIILKIVKLIFVNSSKVKVFFENKLSTELKRLEECSSQNYLTSSDVIIGATYFSTSEFILNYIKRKISSK